MSREGLRVHVGLDVVIKEDFAEYSENPQRLPSGGFGKWLAAVVVEICLGVRTVVLEVKY